MATIAIRAEDKNRWERRAPLTPDHVAELVREHDIEVDVEASPLRVYADAEYAEAGASVGPDPGPGRVVLGVKEIPVEKVQPGRTYVCFSHVIKGQPAGMPLLRRFLEQGCTLVDYEPIVDARGRRIIFFGRHAGYAGMLDTLWALGQRLAVEGFRTPFEELRLAHHYSSLHEALDHVARVGERIRKRGLPTGLRPVAFAFTGSGNVSQGAQEVFERLPFENLEPEALAALPEDRDRPRHVLFRTVLGRAQRFRRRQGGGFDAAELQAHPERYESALDALLPHLTVLVNGVYWDPDQPRLVTREALRALWSRGDGQPKLRVIGDITCDVDGSIEANVRATDPGDPVYVYDPVAGVDRPGVEGAGPVVMAVDNLPCELPREASEHFGDSLLRFVPKLARCDWSRPLAELDLPVELRRAVVAHRGELAPEYRYLESALRGV